MRHRRKRRRKGIMKTVWGERERNWDECLNWVQRSLAVWLSALERGSAKMGETWAALPPLPSPPLPVFSPLHCMRHVEYESCHFSRQWWNLWELEREGKRVFLCRPIFTLSPQARLCCYSPASHILKQTCANLFSAIFQPGLSLDLEHNTYKCEVEFLCKQ